MRDFVKGKRDPLLIILYILQLLSNGPASITHVAYKTNLNHMSAQRYLLAGRPWFFAEGPVDRGSDFLDHSKRPCRDERLDEGCGRRLARSRSYH